MIRFRYLLWPAGLVFGVATEWIGRPDLIILDAPAGYALVFLGLAAWSRKPEGRAGPIMGAAGFAWFLGTAWNPAVFLHRGPLAHLLLTHPSAVPARLFALARGARVWAGGGVGRPPRSSSRRRHPPRR
jgi:hypothetical protein